MTKRSLIDENYVEYIEGSLPIILSAPHGGTYTPNYIQNRQNGIFDLDNNTKELTHEIMDQFLQQTHAYPHTVLMNLSRTKVDANRAVEEALDNQGKALHSYHSFHNFIKDAKVKVHSTYQKGLYIDIHGQSHTHKHIEFGYLLFNDTLKLNDSELLEHQEYSSIKTLGKFSNKCFIEQIKGESSLSGLMQERDFKTIPSKTMPYAKCGNYFEGAYNTKTYSSQDNGTISAIQAEFPYIGCRDNKKNRQKTAKAFVESLIEFMHIHFDINLKKD